MATSPGLGLAGPVNLASTATFVDYQGDCQGARLGLERNLSGSRKPAVAGRKVPHMDLVVIWSVVMVLRLAVSPNALPITRVREE